MSKLPFNSEGELGENPKDRVASKKIDVSLVPPAAILYEALAFEDGARKYGPYNWRDTNVKARVYVAAAIRHLLEYLDGEDLTDDTGLPQLGHVRACMAILIDATEQGTLVDDRPKKGSATRVLNKHKR